MSQAPRQLQAGNETWKVVVAIVVALIAFGGGWLIRDAALSRQAAEETQGRLGALENASDAFWRRHDAELGRARESMARVQQEATRVQEETARAHAEIARLREEVGGVRDDLARARTATAELIRSLEGVVAQLEAARSEVHAVRAESTALLEAFLRSRQEGSASWPPEELARRLEVLSADLQAARSDINAVRIASGALLEELERSQQEARAPSPPEQPAPAGQAIVTYRVRSGDTLSEIAYSLMGSPVQYPVIAEVNQLESADLIRPGQQLKVPVPAAEP